MSKLTQIPALDEGDVSEATCALVIEACAPMQTVQEAWKSLPAQGHGWVMLADGVRRFDPAQRQGLLLQAEVVDGASTFLLRSDGPTWQAWKWTETKGDSHRYFERAYLSSETREAGHLIYRHYWTLQPEDGIQVWQPVGARFCGFKEKS